jgi:hypothetical protein
MTAVAAAAMMVLSIASSWLAGLNASEVSTFPWLAGSFGPGGEQHDPKSCPSARINQCRQNDSKNRYIDGFLQRWAI